MTKNSSILTVAMWNKFRSRTAQFNLTLQCSKLTCAYLRAFYMQSVKSYQLFTYLHSQWSVNALQHLLQSMLEIHT